MQTTCKSMVPTKNGQRCSKPESTNTKEGSGQGNDHQGLSLKSDFRTSGSQVPPLPILQDKEIKSTTGRNDMSSSHSPRPALCRKEAIFLKKAPHGEARLRENTAWLYTTHPLQTEERTKKGKALKGTRSEIHCMNFLLCNKLPQTQWFKQHICIISQFHGSVQLNPLLRVS